MTERRTEIAPTGATRRAVVKGTEMTENIASEIVVRPAAESFANYIEARVEGFADLTANEIVELTFAFHAEWQSSDERRAEREAAKIARELEAEAKRAERNAAREARLVEERAKLEEKLAKLAKG
jgi:hypothetical protein